MTETLTAEAATFPRICVRKPYYALRDLRIDEPGTATCELPVEQPVTGVVSPIGLGEAGRHMAILGLCAAASLAPDDARRYYLARRAEITWLHPKPAAAGGALTGRLTAALPTSRKATAAGLLRAGSVALAAFSLSYDVLKAPVFERMFSHMHHPDTGTETGTETGSSPYARGLELTSVNIGAQSITATVTASPADCAGHFPGYPALPVAVLGTAMVDATSRLIEATTHRPMMRWVPKGRLVFEAHRLIQAGTPVEIDARIVSSNGPRRTILVTASTGEETAASLSVNVVTVHPEMLRTP
ncbi:hypothetical protein [Amycolatopsis sp. DSM 110486]|uniref:hypothetical protein n=1 Tax=Amycolatopsis sp. DSM 110486 TaxID=2865832 RepID=UPI001C69C7E0|nr:hypothetical protein [Amycolatopsis sp. DSM 110486]QYN17470.1 hypothetical protein K1T34_32300 [Amycolatopsis sp. DSM 110486]